MFQTQLLTSEMICCRDPVSGIRVAEIGLGQTRKDTLILAWTPVEDYTHIQYTFDVPNGIPVWVKMRFTNNGLYILGNKDCSQCKMLRK